MSSKLEIVDYGPAEDYFWVNVMYPFGASSLSIYLSMLSMLSTNLIPYAVLKRATAKKATEIYLFPIVI